MREHLTGLCRTPFGAMRRVSRRYPRLARGMVLAAALVFAASGQVFAQRGVTVSFLQDAAASLTIEEAASPEKAGEYQAYVPSFMAFSRIPGDFNGALWLRVAMGPSFEKPMGALRVNFGSGLPGVTRLYVRAADGFTAMESAPRTGVFILPENAPFPDTLYARFDGVPGLWFRPVLEAAPESASGVSLPLILCYAFGAAMLLLLIQYLRKAEEWRLWAAITAGCGIAAAIMPPMPAAGAAFTPLSAATMLMPGLILVFFAHTARHLFDSPRTMPGHDKLLAACYVVGGVVALWPLVPGNLWVARYLPLAGAAMALLLPAAMAAMTRSLKGGMGFFCAALLPVAGVAASAWELTSPGAPLLDGLGGLCGLALGMLALGLTGPIKAVDDRNAEDDVFTSLNTTWPRQDAEPARDDGKDSALPVAGTLRLPAPPWESGPAAARPEEAAAEETPFAPEGDEFPEPDLIGKTLFPGPQTEHAPQPAGRSGAPGDLAPKSALEERPIPVSDAYLHPAREIGEPVSPESPAEETPAMETAPAVADGPGEPEPITLVDEEPLPAENAGPGAAPPEDAASAVPVAQDAAPRLFDLHTLVKEAYDAAAALGEEKNIGMSWFIAPQTGRLFEGQADLLDSALRLLLRDMAGAMDQGNVRLTVRRLPDSKDAGHLVFTAVEWDARETYHARNMAGLAEAWALAEKTGGIFSVEHSPSSGTTVIFSSIFAPMDKPKPAENAEEIAPSAPEAPGFVKTEEPAAPQTPGVGVFADHPDIAVPEDIKATIMPIPPGLDADSLAEKTAAGRAPARIVIADSAASSRARTVAAFKDSPYSVLECASPSAAHTLYTRHPSGLVLMNANMPEVDIAAAIRDIHADDRLCGRSLAPVAAIVGYEAQAGRMMQAGCARAVMAPLGREDLLVLAGELAPLPDSEMPAMAPSAPETRKPPRPEPAPREDLPRESATSPEALLREALADIPPVAPEIAEKRPAEPGFGLLDMIVTDEEPELAVREPEPAPQAVPQPGPQPAREKRAPVVTAAARKEAPFAAKPRFSVSAVQVESRPAQPASAEAPPPARKMFRTPAALVEESAMERKNPPLAGEAAPPISVPLPGEDDSVFRDMLPLLPGLICELDDAMLDAARGKEKKSPLLVQQAVERLAGKAGHFGLAKLERMARCVERAAAADDIEPMECVLADLQAWVTRYKEALNKLHREQQW